MTTTKTPAPIAPGTRLPYRIEGTSYVVTVGNNSRGTTPIWKIVTTAGSTGRLVEAYTKTYNCETTARGEARRLCKELYAEAHLGGPRPATLDQAAEAREDRATELRHLLATQDRRPVGMRDRQAIAAAEAELAAIEDGDTRRLRAELVATVTEFLTAA